MFKNRKRKSAGNISSFKIRFTLYLVLSSTELTARLSAVLFNKGDFQLFNNLGYKHENVKVKVLVRNG